MDALKGHSNGTILGCQKRGKPMHTEKNTKFLGAQWGRFMEPKLLECACMHGMWSVNVIMAVVVVGINSRG